MHASLRNIWRIPVSGALYTVIEFSFAISIANLRVEILLACS